MSRKKTGIIIIVIAAVIAAVLGVRSARNRAEEEQRRQVLMYTRIGYCDDLLIPCDPEDIVYTEDIKNFTIDQENELYVRVKYYNVIKQNNVTMEEIIDSYRAFLNGDTEGASTIQDFHMFRHADVYETSKREVSEDEFRDRVINALKERYGTDLDIRTATREQLDTAVSDAVNQKSELEPGFLTMQDYQTWANEIGYPDKELIANGMEGINSDWYITLPDTPGYESGRIVIGDSRCVQLGIYQQRTDRNEYAVFAAWGGHYLDQNPYLGDVWFQRKVNECFQKQVETTGNCHLYFFTTVNDYDFRENRNEAAAAAAIKWAEQFASMHCEYEGKDVTPSVTVIGIVAGARKGIVLRYPAEEFNRYEEDYNALLKETVTNSAVLQNAEWTTVPEILNNEIGFISDGLHYNDETLKKLADYISR